MPALIDKAKDDPTTAAEAEMAPDIATLIAFLRKHDITSAPVGALPLATAP